MMKSLIDAVAELVSSGPTSTITSPANSGGLSGRPRHGADAAHRMAHHDDTLQTEPIHRRGDVVGTVLAPTISARCPLAFAVPALVQRDAPRVLSQKIARDVEGMRVQTSAVQEDHREIV